MRDPIEIDRGRTTRTDNPVRNPSRGAAVAGQIILWSLVAIVASGAAGLAIVIFRWAFGG